MSRHQTEAPRAVDASGGYYPLLELTEEARELLLKFDGVKAPPSATHYTWCYDTSEVVDFLRAAAVKTSRGTPPDPPSDLYQESTPAQAGQIVEFAFELIEQVAP
jgi:hypothetical protein